ncbi:hypothetical protein SASPL_144861 [Salvia splendens]|uniref:Uncharacterized protein n=1 Tax=Salvia splendens TaxID=180675 RepID=A0A8X8Z7M5_SALSN|nr:hypothetical protein SASPL_144861 [Salvia splendens]
MKSCYCRDRWIEADSAVKPSPTTTTRAEVHKKFDGVPAWFLGGFTAAFFASLERCSCINIATKDDFDDSPPLIAADDVTSPAK